MTLGDAQPALTATTTEIGKVQVHVALFCPTTKAAALEREITADFLSAVRDG